MKYSTNMTTKHNVTFVRRLNTCSVGVYVGSGMLRRKQVGTPSITNGPGGFEAAGVYPLLGSLRARRKDNMKVINRFALKKHKTIDVQQIRSTFSMFLCK